ncbi:MAG: ABC transporter permease [Lactobacillus sp.]|nr:ABC transporter permease [Lactobacillus sp.]
MRTRKSFFLIPYLIWIALFVVLPILLIIWYSFTNSANQFTLQNYITFFTNGTFLMMTVNSFWYAFLITLITLIISYPAAYALTRVKNQQFWLMLIIIPTWINLLLKAYAFIGLLGGQGALNQVLRLIGIGPVNMLFTNTAFILVATYIEIPFMLLPIYNALCEINPAVIEASKDLGASKWQTFRYVILPMAWSGVESGIQVVFIPSLSLFMLTRLIGGNRVITLGSAIEEYFMTTMNWNLGSTIGVILIVMMIGTMLLTSQRKR